MSKRKGIEQLINRLNKETCMKYITKIDSFITYIGWTNFNIPTYQTI